VHGLIATLSGGYHLSNPLIQGLLKDIFGIEISLGTVSMSDALVSEALKPAEEEVKAAIQESSRVHCDETGHRREGKRGWVWIALSGLICLFQAHSSRSAAVTKQLLGENYAGTLISDRYSAYNKLKTFSVREKIQSYNLKTCS
jgi:transposase